MLVHEDITERREAEEERRRAEEKYRSIFENAVEGIFQTTVEGRFLTANPAMARMLGYESPEELLEAISNIGDQLYVEPERREEFNRLARAGRLRERLRGAVAPQGRNPGVDLGQRPRRLRR